MDTVRYSPSAEADAVYAGWVAAAAAFLQSCAPAPRAVVLQGSAACGEAWAVRDDEGGALTLVSDLDLAVILAADADRAAWAAHRDAFPAAMARAAGAERAPGAWSLAVYVPADLPRQLPKMGTLDLAHARVLAGDPLVLAAVQPREPHAISVAESLRLLAVRAHEWDAAAARGDGPRVLLALAVKLLADAGTALVAACGAYSVGGARRRATLDGLWTADLATLAQAVPALPERVRAAQDVRLREARWSEVAAALGVAVDAEPARIAAVWEPLARACAAWLAQRDAGRAGDPALVARAAAGDPAALRAWLAASPRYAAWRAWVRAMRRTAGGGDAGRVFALARACRAAPEPWAVAAVQTLIATTADERAAARTMWQWVAEN